MTYADSSPRLLGMSRTEAPLGAPPVPTLPRAVRLVVWGCTERDADDAALMAREELQRRDWPIATMQRHVGPPCPLRRGDPRARAEQHAADRVWAPYPAGASG